MTPSRSPQPAGSLPASTTCSWLHKGATVYDRRLRRWGVVMALGFPCGESRQSGRVWLRPPPGGIEWNPPIDDLSPTAPATTEPYNA